MKKLLTISATLLAGLTLAACSSSSSSQSNNSSSESSTSNNAKQASSQQKKPLVSKKVSGNDNSSSSKSTKAANVSDPKIIGLLAYQDVFGKSAITADSLYFGSNSGNNNNGNNGQYLIGAGSTVGTISFSINGDTVTIYKMDESSGASDAEAQYTSYDVSLKELEDKYYNTATDQQNTQKAAQNLKDANSSSDDSDQDSSSDDDNSSDQADDDDDNNSADQPSDDQSVDTNGDADLSTAV